MATLENTLKILFRADGAQNVAREMDSISRSMGNIDDKARAFAQPFANIFDSVVKVDAAIAALGAGSLAYAIKEAGDFETQFKEISTLFTTSSEGLDKFRQDILEYSKDSTQAIETINNAVYTAISAGTDYRNSLDLVKEAEKLAIAGKADLNDVTKLLASTMNAYGKDMSDVTNVSDLFFQTVKEGQTTIPELSQSIAQVTSTAAGAGIPLSELTAAISTLTAMGMPTSQAITSIKQAIANIIKPSSQAQDVADKLGISFDAATLKSEGFAYILKTVYERTDGSADKMSKLFGSVEGLNAAIALGADRGGKFTDTLASMRDAAGATATAHEKMAHELDKAWQRMYNSFKVSMIGLGSQFQDETSDVLDALGELFDGFSTTIDSGALDPLIDLVEAAMDDLENIVRNVAENLPEAFEQVEFDNLIAAIENVKSTITEVFNIDLSSAEGLENLLQTMTETFAALLNVTSGMIKGLEGVWKAVGQGVAAMSEVDSEQAETFGNFLTNMKLVAEGGVVLAGAIKGVEKNVIDLKSIFKGFEGAASGVWNSLQTIFYGISERIFRAIQLTSSFFDTITLGSIDAFGELEERARLAAQRTAKDFDKNLGEAYEGFEQLGKAMSGTYSETENEASKLTNTIQDNVALSMLQSAETKETAENTEKQNEEAKKTNENMSKTNITAEQLKKALEGGAENLKAVNGELVAIGESEVNPKITPDTSGVQNALDQTPAEIKARVDMVKARTQLEKIRNDRLEKVVDLKIANVNSETERVKAAFESISQSFSSVTEQMPSLLDSFLGASDLSEEFYVRDIISEQLNIQRESFKLQKDLIGAQIDLYEQKARAVRQGEGLIKIDSTGLEPALEQVLWSIMEKVQMRISEEQSDLLLGCQ